MRQLFSSDNVAVDVLALACLCFWGALELLVLSITQRLSDLVVKGLIDLGQQLADVVADVVGGDPPLVKEARENDPTEQLDDADRLGPAGQEGRVDVLGARVRGVRLHQRINDVAELGRSCQVGLRVGGGRHWKYFNRA